MSAALSASGRTWADEAASAEWELVRSPDEARAYTVDAPHFLVRYPGQPAHLAIVGHPIRNDAGFAAEARLMASAPRLARALEALADAFVEATSGLSNMVGVREWEDAKAALAEARAA